MGDVAPAALLEGRLVRLRAREAADEARYYRWMNDPGVLEHLDTLYPVSHAEEVFRLHQAANVAYERVSLAVETLAGVHIGSCVLRSASPESRSAAIGITIGERQYWDGGYGTETMRLLCRFGFEVMNLHRIQLEVLAGHARGRHVYEKLGFRDEAVRRHALYKNGEYHDVMVMGLLAGERH